VAKLLGNSISFHLPLTSRLCLTVARVFDRNIKAACILMDLLCPVRRDSKTMNYSNLFALIGFKLSVFITHVFVASSNGKIYRKFFHFDKHVIFSWHTDCSHFFAWRTIFF
jgi:hypothetical protein